MTVRIIIFLSTLRQIMHPPLIKYISKSMATPKVHERGGEGGVATQQCAE